ncbi:hypothetical protein PDQ51_28980, partial [Bacillus cereus]|nr:hypothetical protein [Bacillus cereus]
MPPLVYPSPHRALPSAPPVVEPAATPPDSPASGRDTAHSVPEVKADSAQPEIETHPESDTTHWSGTDCQY